MLRNLLGLVFSVAVLAARAEPMPAVAELFTSQGCSSCPPADQLLGELATRTDVIALAYHVDYWDALGWRDRFSLEAATARQRAYARSLALANVYTPQMVVDGTRDVVGSDRTEVLAALAGKRDGIVPVLAAGNGALTVEMPPQAGEMPPQAGGFDATVTLVGFVRSAETKVARGENAGRLLREFAIVRAIYDLGGWNGAARRFSFALSRLPPDCSDVAVLVQKGAQGRMIGAARLSLQ